MGKTDVENKGLNQELFNFICERHDSHDCNRTMGFTISYLGEGVAGLKKESDDKLSTVGGYAHGGVLAALADAVMGEAAETLGGIYKTVDLNIQYLAPALEEDISADGYVVHSGKTIVFSECRLYDKERKIIAKGMGTYIKKRDKPQEICD